VASDSLRPVTLAELVATLSLVADLGMGRPMERVLRQTVVAMRLGAAAGMDRAACSSAYYTSLLTWVGCAVDTSEVAALFGDETELYADSHEGDYGGLSLAVFVARHLGRGKSGFHRIGMVGTFLATAGRSARLLMEEHCQEASDLAGQLGLGPAVCEPLLQAFERWDGRGVPGLVGADRLAAAVRLVHLADSIEAFHHAGGAEAALRVARERRGTQFDPGLVDCFCARPAEILDGLGGISAWEEVIALDPQLGAALTDDQLDRALDAFADFSDLKSPLRLGHSRGVAELAAQAGAALGLPAAEVIMLRRAALVHDIGMIGIPSGVWDEPGGWSISMAWMRMPGQSWPGAATSFLVMWVVMMVAMMLPSLVPMLWRYRQAVGRTGETRLGRLTALVGVGYFFVWTACGMAAFPLGVALAAVEMQLPALARAVPIAVGVVVLIAGALQFTAWKAHHLACCRQAPGRGRTLPADAGTAWRHGLRLGLHCSCCCAGLMAILLVIGAMDLHAMAVVTAAITVERLAPASERVARAIGAVIVGAGLFLIARAAGLG